MAMNYKYRVLELLTLYEKICLFYYKYNICINEYSHILFICLYNLSNFTRL